MTPQTQSRDVILREGDFIPLLQEASETFGGWVGILEREPSVLSAPGVASHLAEAAHDLETFLDDFGARHNRTYATFGELVASTRGLALVASTARHIVIRLPRYETEVEEAALVADIEAAWSILSKAILALCTRSLEEAETLGLSWDAGSHGLPSLVPQRQLLPRNVDTDEAVEEREHIAEIGGRLLTILKASRQLDLVRERTGEELLEFVSHQATEERCRWYESAVHNIQSMYDTYVLRTSLEDQHPWLRTVRGHASIALHLLEMSTLLVHFYARHENDVRHEPARQVVSRIVPKQKILHVAVNICLRQAYLYIEACADLSQQLLDTFVSGHTARLALPEGLTLHARPLSLIVQVARHYGTQLEISLDGDSCSANSLMSLIILGGKHPEPEVIEAKGDERAVRDLRLLFEAGLGEDDTPFPPELDYLRTSG